MRVPPSKCQTAQGTRKDVDVFFPVINHSEFVYSPFCVDCLNSHRHIVLQNDVTSVVRKNRKDIVNQWCDKVQTRTILFLG